MARSRNRKNVRNKDPRKSDRAVEEVSESSGKPNDPSFYNKSATLVRNATDYAFSWNLGQYRNLDPRNEMQNIFSGFEEDDIAGYGQYLDKFTFPGIMELDYVPGVGLSNTPQSAINIAATQLYTEVRKSNSGGKNYDVPDLMMYVVAMDSIYQMYEMLCRVYGITRFVTMYNTYTPKELCFAAGFNYVDALANLPKLKFYINALAIKLDRFKVPDYFDIFKRHRSLIANVFIDAATPRGQLFVFRPKGLLKYEELEGMGQCTYTPLPWPNATVDDLIEYTENLFDGINYVQSAGIMSGDILKAFGEEKCVHLSQIADDFIIAPNYTPSYLMQIHNATIMNDNGVGEGFYDVRQTINGELRYLCDSNGLAIWGEVGEQLGNTALFDRIVDYPVLNPSGDMQLEATRFCVCAHTQDIDTVGYLVLDNCGTEIIVGVEIISRWAKPNSTIGIQYSEVPDFVYMHVGETPSLSDIGTTLGILADLVAYDWAPPVWLMAGDVFHSNFSAPALLWNTQNVVQYSHDDMGKMHQTAIMSEFNVM